MIVETLSLDNDDVLFELLKSNDQEFSQGRAKMSLNRTNEAISIIVTAKDNTAHRAMLTSINNTIKILEKTKRAI